MCCCCCFRLEADALQAEAEEQKSNAIVWSLRTAKSRLRRIKRQMAEENAEAAARAAQEEAQHQDAAQLRQQKESKWVPAAGSNVYVPRLGAVARVISVKNGGNSIELQAGMMKITVTIDEIRRR